MLDLKKWFLVFLIVSAVVANEWNENESENENENGSEEESRSEVEARRRHHLFGFGHRYSHLWIAGLQAIAIFWAIKIKFFIVAIAIGFAIFYGFKVWAGSKLLSAAPAFESIPIIHETEYHAPYEHIIGHTGHDHYSHSEPDIFPNYPGPDPYSAWSSSVEPTFDSLASVVSDPSDIPFDHFHRRNSNTKQKRDLRDATPQNSIETDWTDLIFTFLGVHSMDCRKRFVCEMEIKSKPTKISRMAFKFLSENFLAQYRSVDEPPQSIRHCMKMFSGCEFVNDFDDGEQVDLGEEQQLLSIDDNKVKHGLFGETDRNY